uniref:Low-temperature-induced 65 kDa protein n=1 Tax=Nicotiana tabacum TaxID=4097 RepID=A0A1S4CK52_TOBAC|nr:PREDICTED: low-temperature-induced 65 kDa protein-like [Nicotiana tabacum]
MEAQQRSGHAYEDVTHHSGDERDGKNPVHGQGKVEDEGAQGTKIGLPTVLDDDPNAPKDRPEDKSSSNYQSKVTDPTGANREEAGTTPLVQSFEKMSVNEGIRAEKGAGEEEGKSKATDNYKGVSMKKYLAEKFKPGEEDKALSEVIAGTLSKHKDKTEGTDQEEEAKPTGKVKVSEEVTKQTAGPTDEHGIAAAEGSGKSIVGRIKGVASSWFGKGTGKPAAQTSTVSDGN